MDENKRLAENYSNVVKKLVKDSMTVKINVLHSIAEGNFDIKMTKLEEIISHDAKKDESISVYEKVNNIFDDTRRK